MFKTPEHGAALLLKEFVWDDSSAFKLPCDDRITKSVLYI